MADTFANQKTVYIHKEKYTKDFLQVPNEHWRYAGKILKYGTFKLYLDLAGNSDGFKYYLSKAGSGNNLGISKNVYYRAVEELIEKGYLVEVGGNTYNFYTVPYKGQNQEDTCPVEGTPYDENCPVEGTANSKGSPLQGTPSSPVEGTVNSTCPVEGTPSPLEGTVESRRRDKLSRVRVENIDKYITNNIDIDGHPTGSLDGGFAPLSHPSDAPSKTNKKASKNKKKNAESSNPIAEEIAKHCDCSASEIEGIVNDNGFDYDALLHCVENGYIDGENFYSKKYWESMDINHVLRDPTYKEYLASMYKSNPNGLDGATAKKNDSVDDCLASDDVDDVASTGVDDDMSWLDGLADWVVE